MTGHVSGLPVEEFLPALLGGGVAGLLLWCRSLGARRTPPRPAATYRSRRRLVRHDPDAPVEAQQLPRA
ncbi:MAG: hypothetical protein ACRD0V_06600 [Acidimicrobiales bacterium]